MSQQIFLVPLSWDKEDINESMMISAIMVSFVMSSFAVLHPAAKEPPLAIGKARQVRQDASAVAGAQVADNLTMIDEGGIVCNWSAAGRQVAANLTAAKMVKEIQRIRIILVKFLNQKFLSLDCIITFVISFNEWID